MKPGKLLTAGGPKRYLASLQEGLPAPGRRAQIDLSAASLLNNFETIRGLLPGQEILPMLKANAYGHGAPWVAKLLDQLPNLYAFGVATLREGEELRESLIHSRKKTPIIVFSDTTPWTDEIGSFCERHFLTPVISSEEDWRAFFGRKWHERIPYELQFNTGMNRLGIKVSFAKQISRDLRGKQMEAHPSGIFSHLAIGESPDAKLSRLQVQQFKIVQNDLSSVCPQARFHLGNSAALWNALGFHLRGLTDVIRAGISLYGIPPWKGASQKGIVPVLTLRARVVGVHRLKPGESIGYGATFQVKGKETVHAAILGIGYGDGLPRALSNRGFAWLEGEATSFLGRVSMDLCAVRCRATTQVGVFAELLGPRVDPWAQAEAAGTIPYELLTSLSSRVERSYG